jgi:hypothetical protein
MPPKLSSKKSKKLKKSKSRRKSRSKSRGKSRMSKKSRKPSLSRIRTLPARSHTPSPRSPTPLPRTPSPRSSTPSASAKRARTEDDYVALLEKAGIPGPKVRGIMEGMGTTAKSIWQLYLSMKNGRGTYIKDRYGIPCAGNLMLRMFGAQAKEILDKAGVVITPVTGNLQPDMKAYTEDIKLHNALRQHFVKQFFEQNGDSVDEFLESVTIALLAYLDLYKQKCGGSIVTLRYNLGDGHGEPSTYLPMFVLRLFSTLQKAAITGNMVYLEKFQGVIAKEMRSIARVAKTQTAMSNEVDIEEMELKKQQLSDVKDMLRKFDEIFPQPCIW